MVDNTPVAESTSFHVVRLCDGHVCSRRTFTDDFIHLHHNAGASVQADLIAVLSIRYQVIHLMQVRRSHSGPVPWPAPAPACCVLESRSRSLAVGTACCTSCCTACCATALCMQVL